MMPSPYRLAVWLCDDRGGPDFDPVAVALHRRLVAALGAGRCDEALRRIREMSVRNESAGVHAHNTHNAEADGS